MTFTRQADASTATEPSGGAPQPEPALSLSHIQHPQSVDLTDQDVIDGSDPDRHPMVVVAPEGEPVKPLPVVMRRPSTNEVLVDGQVYAASTPLAVHTAREALRMYPADLIPSWRIRPWHAVHAAAVLRFCNDKDAPSSLIGCRIYDGVSVRGRHSHLDITGADIAPLGTITALRDRVRDAEQEVLDVAVERDSLLEQHGGVLPDPDADLAERAAAAVGLEVPQVEVSRDGSTSIVRVDDGLTWTTHDSEDTASLIGDFVAVRAALTERLRLLVAEEEGTGKEVHWEKLRDADVAGAADAQLTADPVEEEAEGQPLADWERELLAAGPDRSDVGKTGESTGPHLHVPADASVYIAPLGTPGPRDLGQGSKSGPHLHLTGFEALTTALQQLKRSSGLPTTDDHRPEPGESRVLSFDQSRSFDAGVVTMRIVGDDDRSADFRQDPADPCNVLTRSGSLLAVYSNETAAAYAVDIDKEARSLRQRLRIANEQVEALTRHRDELRAERDAARQQRDDLRRDRAGQALTALADHLPDDYLASRQGAEAIHVLTAHLNSTPGS